MAIEGGSAYRNRLVKREQNKKNLIDLRRRQSENPLEWANQLQRGNMEQAYKAYEKAAAKTGLSPEAYSNFIDAAFQSGANMEGIINPTPTKTTFNISNARALEGMKKAGAEGLGIAEVAGRPGSVDVMYKYGQSYYPVPQESFIESLNNMAKFIKDNPRLSAEMAGLGALTSFGRILGTGKSMGADFEAGKGNIGGYGIRPGTAMAYDAENVMGQKAGVADYIDAFTYFVPGVGSTKPVALAAKAVKAAPKTSAAIAGAGAVGFAALQPDEAEAANILQALKFAAGEFGTSRPAFNQYSRVHRALKNAGIYSGDPLYKQIVGTVTNKDAGKMFADFIKKNPTVVDALKREAEQKAKELGVPVEELPPGALRNQLNIMHNPGSEVLGVKSPGFKDAPYSVWGPDVVSVGTKRLNTVTTMAQKDLGTIKSYDEVITWAMKNLPEYKGMSRAKVIEDLGAKHLV